MFRFGFRVQVPGNKALVLDPKISGPLALVAQTSLLKVGGAWIDLHTFDLKPHSYTSTLETSPHLKV